MEFADWPLTKMTAREVFDKVKTHLLTQNEKAEVEGTCRYLINNGLMCAAGCLIPYGNPLQNSVQTWCKLVSTNLVPNKHQALISALQTIHDFYPVDEWQKRLEVVEHKLEAGMYGKAD